MLLSGIGKWQDKVPVRFGQQCGGGGGSSLSTRGRDAAHFLPGPCRKGSSSYNRAGGFRRSSSRAEFVLRTATCTGANPCCTYSRIVLFRWHEA